MSERRIIAQRIKTGEFLTWDVPFQDDAKATRELSGPGGIRGSITPTTKRLLAADGTPMLREWSTALYYEADGQIRTGGIITRIVEDDENGDFHVEAPGFTTYPHGIPYNDLYRPGLGADPLEVVREIWRHLQSYPDGDLGVTVADTTSATVLDDTSGEKPKPYRLPWWEHRDCGTEIDSMLEIAPADYIERHTWNADHTQVMHHIDLGTPRLGRQRHDLRFAEGENVLKAVPYYIEGDEFAQTVIGLGKGEGRKMVRVEVATRDDRLRRVAVIADKGAGHRKIERMARREHARLTDDSGFDTVAVRDHVNARISAIQPGDDIYVEADLDWFGPTREWCRVLAVEEPLAAGDIAVLHVVRSSRFAN